MPIRFTKRLIAAHPYETAGVFDVDNDGHLDIVSGAFWYAGPDFRHWHRLGDVLAAGEYFDDFSTIPVDVNGDGLTDFITGGWWGNTLRWRQNPGRAGAPWPEHVIAETGNVETARAWDVDGDGYMEIVPNTPGHPLCVYRLDRNAEGVGQGRFTRHEIYGSHGHGLGFGDVNGDGRGDFVLHDGWLEAPQDPWRDAWIFHPEFELGADASVPILVADVNADGLNDLIVGSAHSYGLSWWEQSRDGQGQRTWRKHPIDPFNAQYHDLHWVDIDGDGQKELITGKRYRAHPNTDPGDHDDLGIYYFKWTGEGFAKQIIDYGPPGVGAGCGIHFCLADLRGTGRLDVIAPGKDGLHVYYNEG